MSFFWLSAADEAAVQIPGNLIARESEQGLPAEILRSGADGLILHIAGERDRERAWPLLAHLHAVIPVWIYEPAATIASSTLWIKAGAAHVATRLPEIEELMESWVDLPPGASVAGGLIGRSPAMNRIARDIAMVSARRCSVLLEGETGTGKEVVARAIHNGGSRSRGPWVAVNCGAIPESLLEAELFGHVKGAFTGAIQSRPGKFEAANHGSIFLDEIGDMPLATQSKLLRVLQEREIERLGGNERIRLDVRVIAATNSNLSERVRQGLFRADLFYRLNVFRLEIPPLRERPDDIAALADHFIEKVCANEGLALKRLDSSTLLRLSSYDWPGNVRELENVIEAAVVVSGARSVLFPADLRLGGAGCAYMAHAGTDEASSEVDLPFEGLDYHRTLEEFEKSLLTQALKRSRGNKTAAASLLRMKRTTLAARMRVLETRLPRLVA